MGDTTEDDRIAAAHESLARSRALCEVHRNRVVATAASWVADWWRLKTLELIRLRPETAITVLGPDGLARLRTQLDELRAQAPELAAQQLDDRLPWPHQADDESLIRHVTTNAGALRHRWTPSTTGRLSGPLDHALRVLAGRVGPLVLGSGLDSWHVPGGRNDAGGGWVRSGGEIRWGYVLDYADDLVDVTQQYSNALGGLEAAAMQLHEAQHARLVDEALRLWDSVETVMAVRD